MNVLFTIIDVDECATDLDICEQLCDNTVGSYTCYCRPPYSRTFDSISCLG